ncbi:MAG TPA: hypothetical protein HPP54_08185 [Nitrospinae bacterium]|nr:hypothetical protein [Nitrospinota bacterium]
MKIIGLPHTNVATSSRFKMLQKFLALAGDDYAIEYPNVEADKTPEQDIFSHLKLSSENLYVMYGFYGVCPTISKLIKRKIDFIFIDNGYTKTKHMLFQQDYTKSQHVFSVTVNNTRLNRITQTPCKTPYLQYRPRVRRGGDNIILCVPSPYVARAHGFLVDEWVERAKWNVRKLDKRIIVRKKSDAKTGVPFKELLDHACLTVTSQSLTGLESIAAGVPVITDSFTLSAPVSNPVETEYRNLSELYFPDEIRYNRWMTSLMGNEIQRCELDESAKFRCILRRQKKAFHNYEISDIQSQFAR